jgi:hypothetical protein
MSPGVQPPRIGTICAWKRGGSSKVDARAPLDATEAAAAFGQPRLCDLASEAPGRAFFDAVHPSATVHAAFAEHVEEALAPAPIPLPAGGLLGLGGLLALGALGWRRPRRA